VTVSEFAFGARTLDRVNPMPLWAQLEVELRRRLDAGDFNSRFPTDLELTEIYEVSRHTARHAVSRLDADGMVTRQRGRGTMVNKRHFEQPLGALYSLFQLVESSGEEQRSKVLQMGSTTNDEAAAQLGLAPGTETFYLGRLRHADGDPLAIDHVWMPIDIGQNLVDSDFTHTALYQELDRLELPRPDRGDERIHPLIPSAEDRNLLGVARSEAAFRLERRGFCGDRQIEWRVTVVRGDRFTFVADWSEGQALGGGLRAASSKR